MIGEWVRFKGLSAQIMNESMGLVTLRLRDGQVVPAFLNELRGSRLRLLRGKKQQ